jgi:hypothetical protein
MANNNHHLITVDVFNHLIDCPPHDESIPKDQIEEIAKAIVANFDYSLIYDKIDQMACQMILL